MKPLLPALAVALAASGIANAATNGTEGPDSTATVDMSLTVSNPAPFIQITGLQDFDVVLAPGEASEFLKYFVCVYVSEPSVLYSLTIDAPPLSDGQNSFDYNLTGSVYPGGTFMRGFGSYDYSTSNDPQMVTYSDFTPSNAQDCSDGTMLSLASHIPASSVETNGQATATVTMTVEPE